MSEVEAVTASEAVRERQGELVNEMLEIDSTLGGLREQIKALERKRALRVMEYELLENCTNLNRVKFTYEVTRLGQSDRLPIEDCVKEILHSAGRPMAFGEIRAALEKFNYAWNNYISAHNYITRNCALERVSRGYYQLLR